MVSQRVIKPSRSDDVIDPVQELKIADQVRAHFESTTPKRPTKPSRSEPDPDESSDRQAFYGPIPELERLHSIKSQSQVVLPLEGERTVQEEFVATDYYKELVSIDKQHHTTGTGFIKVRNERVENGLSENGREINKTLNSYACLELRSNPATNDWIPCDDCEQVVYISSKPSRSG